MKTNAFFAVGHFLTFDVHASLLDQTSVKRGNLKIRMEVKGEGLHELGCDLLHVVEQCLQTFDTQRPKVAAAVERFQRQMTMAEYPYIEVFCQVIVLVAALNSIRHMTCEERELLAP